MEERIATAPTPMPAVSVETSAPDLPPPHLDLVPVNRRADLLFLGLLILLSVGLRAWQLTHTAVTARDSIGYIRIAWDLEHGDWATVVRGAHQHPAYPVAIRAMSVPVRRFVPDMAATMQLSAQLVSALASVLLVVPLYYLGRELFARNVAFWCVLLFQCLPSSGRIMADGLSEPLFLVFTATALVLAMAALRNGSWWVFALAGLASGAAYLTRPEGAFVAAATGLVLVAQQASRWRRSWPVVLKGGTALSVGTLLLAGPFMLLIGGLTLKASAIRAVEGTPPEGAPWLKSAVTTQPFAFWWSAKQSGLDPSAIDARRGWGYLAIVQCVAKGLFYVCLVPALIGLWFYRDRFRLVPGTAMLLLMTVLLLLALYRVAMVVGYLSDRHTLLITMFGCLWAAAGSVVIGRWLASWDHRPFAASAWTTAVLVLLCTGSAVKSLDTMHAERLGFREAGYWLAKHAQPGDRLLDPYTWATYYSGRVFQDKGMERQSGVCYVVLDVSPNTHSHLDFVDVANQVAKTGREVRRWSHKRGDVAIYEVK